MQHDTMPLSKKIDRTCAASKSHVRFSFNLGVVVYNEGSAMDTILNLRRCPSWAGVKDENVTNFFLRRDRRGYCPGLAVHAACRVLQSSSDQIAFNFFLPTVHQSTRQKKKIPACLEFYMGHTPECPAQIRRLGI